MTSIAIALLLSLGLAYAFAWPLWRVFKIKRGFVKGLVYFICWLIGVFVVVVGILTLLKGTQM
jgi:hypothetical protein